MEVCPDALLHEACSERFVLCYVVGLGCNAAAILLCLICTAARHLRERVISHGVFTVPAVPYLPQWV